MGRPGDQYLPNGFALASKLFVEAYTSRKLQDYEGFSWRTFFFDNLKKSLAEVSFYFCLQLCKTIFERLLSYDVTLVITLVKCNKPVPEQVKKRFWTKKCFLSNCSKLIIKKLKCFESRSNNLKTAYIKPLFYLQSYYHILFSTCKTFLNMSWVYYVMTNNNYKLLTIFQCVDVYLNEPIKVDELIELSNHSIQKHTFHRNNKDKSNSCFWKQKIS